MVMIFDLNDFGVLKRPGQQPSLVGMATSEFPILRNRFLFWTGSIFWIRFYYKANKYLTTV